MKTAKLVLGILCIVFTMFVLFQSCAAGVVDAIEDQGGTSGAGGMLLAVLMLSGGIVEIATRKAKKNGAAIATAIIFFLAAIMGFSNAGNFSDLNIWAGWCVINGIVNVAGIFLNKDKKDTEE